MRFPKWLCSRLGHKPKQGQNGWENFLTGWFCSRCHEVVQAPTGPACLCIKMPMLYTPKCSVHGLKYEAARIRKAMSRAGVSYDDADDFTIFGGTPDDVAARLSRTINRRGPD